MVYYMSAIITSTYGNGTTKKIQPPLSSTVLMVGYSSHLLHNTAVFSSSSKIKKMTNILEL